MLLHIFKRYFCCDSTRNLNGKIAVVTGASVGIGYATVYELLKNGVKHICMIDKDDKNGKSALKKIRKKFGEDSAIFIKTDVTKYKETENAFKKVCEKWGQMDIVINNAGVLCDKEWELTIAVNVSSVVKGSQLAYKYMSKENGGKGGVLINLSSILGMELFASCPLYTSSKHFIRAYSQCLGMPYHYCKSGIRLLIMCPGVTTTPMISNAHAGTESEEDFNEMVREQQKIPIQPVECVSKSMIHMIKHGNSGSCWISEGHELYEVIIPERQTLKKVGLIKVECEENKQNEC